jgi:malate/lactate dehydrogenase
MADIAELTRNVRQAGARCVQAETGAEYEEAHAAYRAAREALDAALAADSGA